MYTCRGYAVAVVVWAALALPARAGTTWVLPFQFEAVPPQGDISLAVAEVYGLPRVVDQMLAVHDKLVPHVMSREQMQRVFADVQGLLDWTRDPTAGLPAGVQTTAKADADEYKDPTWVVSGVADIEHAAVTMQLHDPSAAPMRMVARVTCPVDLPGLQAFRRGVLELLAKGGLAPSPEQAAKMLWIDPLGRDEFVGLGGYAMARMVCLCYDGQQNATLEQLHRAVFGGMRQQLADLGAACPESYLLALARSDDLIAGRQFQAAADVALSALRANPAGWRAMFNLEYIAAERGDEAEVRQWEERSSAAAGRPVSQAALEMLLRRARANRR